MDKLYLRPMLRLCRIVHRSNQRPRRQDDLGGAEKPGAEVPRNNFEVRRRQTLCPGPIRIGVLRAVSHRALPKIWGEVRQNEISRINLLNQLTVGFGLVANTLPFGIVTEGLPVGGRGLSARMREDVDESFAFQRFVGGRPVRHVFYSMLLEELRGVFAKAPQQVVQFAVVSVIDTEFVDRCCGLSGARLLLTRGKPGCCRWEQRCCGKRLKKGASFHGSDSTRAL